MSLILKTVPWLAALVMMCPCFQAGGQDVIVHDYDNVYQWQTEINSPRVPAELGYQTRAFLWIPPQCGKVKAVLICGHNAMEEGVIESFEFRQGLSDMDMALVWVSPGWEPSDLFYVPNGAQDGFEEAMEELAEKSGYDELRTVPVAYMSQSAQASSPYNFAAWNPDRTLAIISMHGDSPLSEVLCCGHVNPYWGSRNIDGIPALMCVGEYEWGEFRIESAFPFMKRYPDATLSLLCDAGHSHSDCSEFEMEYILAFLRKAMEYRIDDEGHLRKLDKRDGWLADRWYPENRVPQQPYSIHAAPFAEYAGDRDSCFWYFDEEMAGLTEEYYLRERGKQPQKLVAWQNGKPVDKIRFTPEEDGLTFHFQVKYDGNDHSSSPVQIRREYGPVRILNDSTFRITFHRTGFDGRKTGWMMFDCYANADSRYKRAILNLELRIPDKITDGQPQEINFPGLNDVYAGYDEEIRLLATSSSGLPVSFYVESGPAIVKGDSLILTGIPPRAKFPVEVTVVAWQYGISGQWQSATPVKSVFRIWK